MTHLTVRQYLDAHGIDATWSDCIHLAKCAQRYSRLRNWPSYRRWTGSHTAHTYDERAIAAVCKNFRHSEVEQQCTHCLKMKRKKAFYRKGQRTFSVCRSCYNRDRRRKGQTFEARERLRLRNEKSYRRRKVRQYSEIVEVGVAANR